MCLYYLELPHQSNLRCRCCRSCYYLSEMKSPLQTGFLAAAAFLFDLWEEERLALLEEAIWTNLALLLSSLLPELESLLQKGFLSRRTSTLSIWLSIKIDGGQSTDAIDKFTWYQILTALRSTLLEMPAAVGGAAPSLRRVEISPWQRRRRPVVALVASVVVVDKREGAPPQARRTETRRTRY